MGFEVHSANFLKYTLKNKSKDNAVQIGRQSVELLPDKYLKKEFGILDRNEIGSFAELLLTKYFRVKNVESIDFSDYEDSTFVWDMNKPFLGPLADRLKNKFDLAIDFGTLEHIFNVPQALFNISYFCSSNADIVHVLPANGWVGHGFYQFSPELFYSVYSEENGYLNTEVFLANCNDNKHWYLVKKPTNGERSCAEGDGEAYILVKTTKMKNEFQHNNIQQSDWVPKWDNSENTAQEKKDDLSFFNAVKNFIRQYKLITRIYRKLYFIFRRWVFQITRREKISGRNRCLTKLNVYELIK